MTAIVGAILAVRGPNFNTTFTATSIAGGSAGPGPRKTAGSFDSVPLYRIGGNIASNVHAKRPAVPAHRPPAVSPMGLSVQNPVARAVYRALAAFPAPSSPGGGSLRLEWPDCHGPEDSHALPGLFFEAISHHSGTRPRRVRLRNLIVPLATTMRPLAFPSPRSGLRLTEDEAFSPFVALVTTSMVDSRVRGNLPLRASPATASEVDTYRASGVPCRPFGQSFADVRCRALPAGVSGGTIPMLGGST